MSAAPSTWLYRKPDVLRGLPEDGHAVIEASAGTGKTYTLEHLVVDLVLRGTSLGEILVVTFTEKAAGELRTRVRALFETLLLGEAKHHAPAGTDPAECWTIDDAARGLLEAALRGYDSASISTIHSFCQRVLTENAFANGRLFDEEVADGRELFAQAFRDVLRGQLAVDPELKAYLELWTREKTIEDLEALLWECTARRGRIVPGFDRKAIDAAIKSLGKKAKVVQAIDKAKGRKREHLEDSVEAIFDALQSYAADGTEVGAYVKLQGVFAATATDSNPRALDYARDRFTASLKKHADLAPIAEALDALAAAIPGARAMVASRFVPLVQQATLALKLAQGRFDFQDMLSRVDEVLGGQAGAGLLATMRERYRCALIDEFQDTDEVQWRVFRRIFFESKDGHRLLLVGDPKQAIYGFRGADVQTYLAARREVVEATGAEPAVLEENFRSTEPLIEAYNEIFREGFFQGEIGYDHPVRCGRPALRFEDSGDLGAIHVFVTGTDSTGKDRVFERLAPAIAREIRRLVDPRTGAKWKGKPLDYGDVFVLGRGGDDLRRVAEALRAAGVPHAFYKQEGLFQSPEAQALEDVLAAVADPADRARRYRAWMTPFFELSLTDVAKAADAGEEDALVRRLADWHRLAARRDHERLFAALLEDSGLVRRRVLFEAGDRALTNFLHILEVLREQFVVRGASVEDMVRALRSWRQEARKPPGQNGNLQRLETDAEAVQLLSMHMSKGLEAPVVFVVGGLNNPPGNGGVHTVHGPAAADALRERLCLVGSSPEDLAGAAAAEAAEEDRRLLYVALTRAMGRLYLPFAGRAEGGLFTAAERDLTGCYAVVNARLAQLLPQLSGPAPRPNALFTHSVLFSPGAGQAFVPEQEEELDLDPKLLAPPPAVDLRPLRKAHAGLITTSFSSLRDRLEGPKAQTKSETRDAVAPSEDELPGGAATGSFLHEVLAEIDPKTVLRCEDGKALLKDPEAARLFETWARRWGVGQQHLPRAADLVHTAMTSPLALGPHGKLERGIAGADALLREMDFLYPIPEADHPRLSETRPRPHPQPHPDERGGERGGVRGGEERRFEIRRGFVVGFVDVLFERQGRVYLADWKSNCLAAFDREHVEAEVEHSYALQGRLYTLALVKMLGVHDEAAFEARFGGLFFLFLRGMKAGGTGEEGVWFRRPTWADVLSWESEVLAMDLDREAGGDA